MSSLHYRVNFSVPWHIKKIQVEDSNSPNKFNKMIRAIRNSKSVPGYSEVLWQVSQPNAFLAWNLGHAVLAELNIHIPQRTQAKSLVIGVLRTQTTSSGRPIRASSGR